MAGLAPELRRLLREGTVIPAHPLALNERRRLDERRQRALSRYYLAAGAGGVAVGVHTTQFAIREAGLLEPVLRLAAEEAQASGRSLIKVAGVCGSTGQAIKEAQLAARLGYDLALVSLAGLADAQEADLVRHVQTVMEIIPLFGFYLQPAIGGRPLSYSFWRNIAELSGLEAIKIAPFDRYRTADVVRAVCASSRRNDIALYTGNDDNIVIDLLTPYRFTIGGEEVEKRIVGGLLGHWAIWTRKAVELLDDVKACRTRRDVPARLLSLAVQITDANAAVFDAAHQFKGGLAGIHEVLRRQGLLDGRWCLDPEEKLSPGQEEEIERVCRAYPHLIDDDFVAAHLRQWLE